MSEHILGKDQAWRNADRENIEAQLSADLYFGELLPAYDEEDFRARSAIGAHLLRAVRRSEVPDDIDEFEHLVGALNSLQEYVLEAEENPSTSLLRPGQIPLMRELADYFEYDAYERLGGHVILPTSTGKTVLFTELIHATGLKSLIVVPTKELITQTHDKFIAHARGRHLDIGFVYGDEKNPGNQVTITTYASLNINLKAPPEKRLIRPEEYRLIIYDEVHKLLGPQYRQAVHAFPKAIQLGYTATGEYSDEKQVADVLPLEVSRWDIIEGQNRELVAPHRSVLVQTDTDMRKVYVASTGEFAQDVLYETINTNKRNQLVIDSYKEMFPGKKAIAYCAGIEHAKHLAEMMQENGIAAAHINGNMTKAQRKDILDRLKAGSENGGIDVITNDRVLEAGFDEDTLEVALLVAPTLSYLKLLQNAGRVTRLWDKMPDKVAYIVQYLDVNYAQPPILFAEAVASGHSEHAWEGFKFPALLEDIILEDATVITDPYAIRQLAEEHTARRETKRPTDPPEGWLQLEEVGQLHDVRKSRIQQALNRFRRANEVEREKREAHGKDSDDLFDIEAHSGKYQKRHVDPNPRIYISPQLAEQIKDYIAEYHVRPNCMWRTAEEIAALYQRSDGWVKTALVTKQLREAHPDLWGKYTADVEDGRTRNYFSPELISIATKKIFNSHIDDYAWSPPESWLPEAEVQGRYSEEEYELALPRLIKRYSYHNDIRYGRQAYEKGGEEVFYVSPKINLNLDIALQRPNDMYSLAETAGGLGQYQITPQDLERELIKLIEKDPYVGQFSSGKYWDGNKNLVYYCTPKVAAHIIEQATRVKLEAKLEEEKLLQQLEEQEAVRAAMMVPSEESEAANADDQDSHDANRIISEQEGLAKQEVTRPKRTAPAGLNGDTQALEQRLATALIKKDILLKSVRQLLGK